MQILEKVFLIGALWCCFGTLIAEEREPIFVSLGSHCEVAVQIRDNELRTTAFPVDWLLTLDHSQFLSLLQEDFKYFLDKKYLRQSSNNTLVVNTHYNIEFRHDWPDMNFEKHFPEILDKYQRRIQRFRALQESHQRVYFIRVAYDYEAGGPSQVATKDCNIISYAQAKALKTILDQKFPNVDFYLIIVNYAEEQAASIGGLNRVIEFKIRKNHKVIDYKKMFRHLLKMDL